MSAAVGMTPDWKQWQGELVAGEFALEQFLGAGKRSAVFRTRPASGNGSAPNRAIKLVQVRAEDAKPMVDRWNRAGGLEHSHLLKIVKTGTWTKAGSSLAYLVTEYADENLGSVLEERALTTEEAFEMLRPIASTLAYLHGRGLVLGNLRPANIFAVDETLKVASDAIAAGDSAGDMKALATTLSQVLTQKPELNGIESLPAPFREIVRNCVGANGQPAWSAADLVSWLRSPHSLTKPAQPANARPKPKPRITRYAIVTGAIFLAVIVIGSMINNRRNPAPASSAQSAPAVAPQQPAAQPSNPVKSNPAGSGKAAANAPAAGTASSTPAPSKGGATGKPAAQPKQPESTPVPTQASAGDARAARADSSSSSLGQAVEQPMPEITAKARGTIHGTVVINIKATIDETGVVTDTALQPTNSRYLGKLCAQAVRQWRFTPSEGGSRQRTVRFVITQADTHASVH